MTFSGISLTAFNLEHKDYQNITNRVMPQNSAQL